MHVKWRMVAAIRTLFAHMIIKLMILSAFARQASQIRVVNRMWHAKVRFCHWLIMYSQAIIFLTTIWLDSCLVGNGVCDTNADCTHESKTNAVICVCKVGYVNTAPVPNVVCTGRRSIEWMKLIANSSFICRCLSSEERWLRSERDLLTWFHNKRCRLHMQDWIRRHRLWR